MGNLKNAKKAATIKAEGDAYRAKERKLEKKRNSRYFDAGKGRRLVRIDDLLADIEGEKREPAWLSDQCHGVELMVDSIDSARDHLADALQLLRDKAPYTLPVFKLILKNGSNRERSIQWLMKHPPKDGRAKKRR